MVDQRDPNEIVHVSAGNPIRYRDTLAYELEQLNMSFKRPYCGLVTKYTIAVSGGFDPLHGGHLAMLQDAAVYGKVIVILNTDEWLLRKKGTVFLPYEEREAILRAMSCVHDVVKATDDDGSVCNTLRLLQPTYFANGGDRNINNTPEKAVCEELGIEMLYGIGGAKTNSSSWIAEKAWVKRDWGSYKVLEEGEGYKIKRLIIDPGKGTSLQRHYSRAERWVLLSGKGVFNVNRVHQQVSRVGEHTYVAPADYHSIGNTGDVPMEVLEIQTGMYLTEDDIERIAPTVYVGNPDYYSNPGEI